MKWNEFAKVGCKVVKAFKGIKGLKCHKIMSCDSVLGVLDRLRIEDGYSLVAAMDYESCLLFAAPSSVIEDPKTEAWNIMWNSEYDIWNHVTVEMSEMGAWQACLLDFARAWLPQPGHGGYCVKTYVFSTASLRSIVRSRFFYNGFDFSEPPFNPEEYINDPRIIPSVEMEGRNVVIRHCFWSAWKGFVIWTDYAEFDESGSHIYYKDSKEEILYEYDCGVCF